MAASKLCLEPLAERVIEPKSSPLFPAKESFEVEPAFKEFIASCPPINATIIGVRTWIRSWFDVCEAFIADIALQPYIDRIELPGFLLHSLKKKETLFEYLESINKSGDRNARVYDEEVLIELTKYIFAAKAYFMTRPLSDEEIKLTEKLDLNNSRPLGRGKKKENIFMGIAKGKAKSESKTEVVAEVTVTRVELLSPREFRERQLEVYKQSMVDRHNSKLTLKASRADLQPHLAQAGQSTLLRYPLAFRTRA